MNFFTLRRQIGLLGLLGIIGSVAVGGIALNSNRHLQALEDRATASGELTYKATRLESGLLDARRAEKDFLLRLDESYATRHGEIVRTISTDLNAIASAVAADAQKRSRIEEIKTGFAAYATAATDLFATFRRLGLNENSGLQGSLRTSVRAVEQQLASQGERDLTILMLQMRRHEKDFMLRLDPRFGDELRKRGAEFDKVLASSPLPPAVRTEIASRMAAYQRDFAAYLDGRMTAVNAVKALSNAYAAVDPIVEGVIASISADGKKAQVEMAESRASVEQVLWWLTGGVLLMVGALSILIGRAIARPIAATTQAMKRLAAGDTSVEVVGGARRDEIGAMAQAVEVFKQNAVERMRLEEEARSREAVTAAEKRKATQALAAEFEAKVGGLVEHLSTAANEMEATARSMSSTAEQTNQQSGIVAASAEETATNVQAVATATEELASSASEIGSQVSQTTAAAAKAVEDARRTNETVQALAASAQRIGDVVKLISDIASQTNLLALNATIEAARAGEAGRGFAVVAAEVKELASQTGRATGDIASQIAQIQTATDQAVQAIQDIGTTIERMHAIAMSVAAAVEEQQAATQEIARNVSQAAQGTEEVTQNIGEVQQAATQTGSAAAQVLGAAGKLSRNASTLSREVAGFLAGIRAA